jgi:hypothetical protein
MFIVFTKQEDRYGYVIDPSNPRKLTDSIESAFKFASYPLAYQCQMRAMRDMSIPFFIAERN